MPRDRQSGLLLVRCAAALAFAGALGFAAALAFARVLAFAAVVTGLATSFSLAGVLASTIMGVFRVGGEKTGGSDI